MSTSIPTLAHGGRVGPGGRAIVGERGPELLSLDSRGGLVTPVNRGQLSSLQSTRIPGLAHGGTIHNTAQNSPIVGSNNPTDPGSTSNPGVNFGSQFDFSNGFDLSPGATGEEILSLPAVQALYGNTPGGFPGDQTFDLPEVDLFNIPGIAAGASLFRPGILTPQEQNDLYSLYGVGYNIPQSAIQHIVNKFTPGSTAFGGGQGGFTQPLGF